MDIVECLSIVKQKGELPRLIQTKVSEAFDSGDVGGKILEAMKCRTEYLLASSNILTTTEQEALRAFLAMLDEEEKTKDKEDQQQQQQLLQNDDDGKAVSATEDAKELESSSSPSLRKLCSVLENEAGIPCLVRKVFDQDHNLILDAYKFCNDVRVAIDNLLQNLDSDRDSEKEVETAIQLFPNLLIGDSVTSRGDRPIVKAAMNTNQRCNVKSVSFVPLLAKLGLDEFGTFGTVNRGGLLTYNCHDMNVLRYLAMSSSCRCCYETDTAKNENQKSQTTSTDNDNDSDNDNDNDNEEHQILVDEINLTVMKQLREQNLFHKEDIQREDLIDCLLCCDHDGEGVVFFAEKRFQYLADLDPVSLTKEKSKYYDGILPLHRSVINFKNTKAFRAVLEAGIHHFPTKVGFLFHKDESDRTPFEMACKKYGREGVTKIVEDIFADHNFGTSTTRNYNGRRNTTMTVESLILSAVDETVHLDAVYFLLRREPSVLLQKALSRPNGAGAQKRKRDSISGNNDVE